MIPCWGQPEFTRQCLGALKSHTRRLWELIVVDNGSTDGTPDYLADVIVSSSLGSAQASRFVADRQIRLCGGVEHIRITRCLAPVRVKFSRCPARGEQDLRGLPNSIIEEVL